MRIASWNVNSIRTRKHRVIDFLHASDIDVALMQETKCTDWQFPFEDFSAAGYDVAHWGLNQWNGVAIASRLPMTDIERGFPGMPGFSKDPASEPALEARALSAVVDGVRLWSVYVPNGRSLEDPHYTYKLSWLAALGDAVAEYQSRPEALPVAVCGDFNIAPMDSDVGDPNFQLPGQTHTSPAERDALGGFLERGGLVDVVRPFAPEGYTFWDYKQGKFSKNHGLRIDFVFASAPLQGLVLDAWIARDERTGEGPSDHVPVVVELEGDDDDRPMVF